MMMMWRNSSASKNFFFFLFLSLSLLFLLYTHIHICENEKKKAVSKVYGPATHITSSYILRTTVKFLLSKNCVLRFS